MLATYYRLDAREIMLENRTDDSTEIAIAGHSCRNGFVAKWEHLDKELREHLMTLYDKMLADPTIKERATQQHHAIQDYEFWPCIEMGTLEVRPSTILLLAWAGAHLEFLITSDGCHIRTWAINGFTDDGYCQIHRMYETSVDDAYQELTQSAEAS